MRLARVSVVGLALLPAALSAGCNQGPSAPASPVVPADSEEFRRAQAEHEAMLLDRKEAEAKARKRLRGRLPEDEG